VQAVHQPPWQQHPLVWPAGSMRPSSVLEGSRDGSGGSCAARASAMTSAKIRSHLWHVASGDAAAAAGRPPRPAACRRLRRVGQAGKADA
jgi:hypothetical protein